MTVRKLLENEVQDDFVPRQTLQQAADDILSLSSNEKQSLSERIKSVLYDMTMTLTDRNWQVQTCDLLQRLEYKEKKSDKHH